MGKVLCAFYSAIPLFFFCTLPCYSKTEIKTELSSSSVRTGSLLVMTLGHPEKIDITKVEVFRGDLKYTLIPWGEQKMRVLIPVDHKETPGDSQITIKTPDQTQHISFKILDGEYASEVLTVDPRHVNPSKKDLIRIQKEKEEVGKIYRQTSFKQYWKGPFSLPIQSPMTSPYGTKRLFNGEMQSYHQGMDLKARVGTPVRAASAGKVVLAKHLFFTGYTILIDHGYGLYTLYAHLSKLKVKKGNQVSQKQLIGLAGATGRANGPHLHWGAVVGGIKINPQDLIKVLN